ncbi:guanylate-binding protein 1-like isoform X2 [Hyla sarda]|uniref:guanylate-binding protein 1-like isoform X2 n=1 Tax=Hyla sarda TaxID=327740 RepID=UPI0024C395C1|nr:guanylate-binding protein 1-like isoform X2 [Hyla sarda]
MSECTRRLAGPQCGCLEQRIASASRKRTLPTMPPVISMPLPICLIENVEGNKLVVNKEAEKILLAISQPVVVIAIIGKYRTGKSYLMNKLAGSKTGFALGSSIQSKTKGIWMWCVPHPQNSGQTLILLDTEGLGDVEKGDCKNDAWIFSLAVLLSSAFVFNSLGTIDQQSMEQLHYVTELTKLIKLKSTEKKENTGEYKRFFPSFTWCVRDFTLLLEKDGKEITEDEYLLSSLEPKKGTDKLAKNYNLPRECILHFFHTHKCFVFDRPATKKKLQILETLEENELDEEFVKQAGKFYSYMISNSRVKTLEGGTEVTGRMLAVLTDSYVKAIQSGTVPCMENAVLALAEIENTGALQDALSKYECEMNKRVQRFPTETQQEFLNMHIECEKEAIKVFLGRSLNDKDQKYQRKMKEKIDNKMNEFSARNEKASRDLCRKLLQELSVTMENNVMAGEYSVPGGHKKYIMEKLRVMEAYNVRPGKGMKALEVIQEYMNEKKDIEAAIIQADETLTEKERQLAEERAQTENAERERQIMEQNNRDLQQSMEDQNRSFEQHKKMLMERMEQDRKMMQQQNELVISQKLKEQEMMMKAGFEDKIASLQEEIRALRNPPKSSCIVL